MLHPKLYIITRKVIKYCFGEQFIILWQQSFKVIFALLKHNGTLFTIHYLKGCRLLITRYICGKPLYINDMRIATKGGWPVKFIFLKNIIGSTELKTVKFLLTVMNISKALYLKKGEEFPVSYDSITSPQKGDGYTIPYNFIRDWVFENRMNLSKPLHKWTDHYLSMKQGPNGPTSLSIFKTIFSLSNCQMGWIMKILSNRRIFIDFYGACSKDPEACKRFLPKSSEYEDSVKSWNITSRLALVHAPEGKERVIGIVDYFTQFTLKPIHEAIFRILRKLPSDRTFSQNPFNKWIYNDHYFWSLDLSAATDRLPIALQEKIIECLYSNQDLAYAWRNLLVTRDYWTHTGKPLRYVVGQPMGAYSSWAMLAITHHLIVAWAAHLCGMPGFTNYIILGDDIVIQHNTVARKYIQVMTKLGVDISKDKTHVSKDTYEFAKRWIHKGKEITGIPIQGISENISNPFIIYMILRDWYNKGNIYLASLPLTSLVRDLFYKVPIFKIKGSKKLIPYSRKYLKRLEYLSLILQFNENSLSYEKLRNYLANLTNNSEFVIPPERESRNFMIRVLSCGLVSSFISSVDKSVNLLPKLMKVEEDINYLSTWPITHGVIKHIRESKTSFQAMVNEEITLFDAIRKVVFLDSNEFLAWDKRKFVIGLESMKIFRKSTSILKYDADHILTGGPYNTNLLESEWMIQNFNSYIDALGSSFKPLERKE